MLSILFLFFIFSMWPLHLTYTTFIKAVVRNNEMKIACCHNGLVEAVKRLELVLCLLRVCNLFWPINNSVLGLAIRYREEPNSAMDACYMYAV